MEKKYIATFHHSYNYGAFLQCFALHRIIENSIVLNYTPGYYVFVKRLKKLLPFFWRFVAVLKYLNYLRKNGNRHFIEYPLLKKTSHFTIPWFQRHKYRDSIVICGSDQIWNPAFCYSQEDVYFANFATFSKKISYAASLGNSSWPKEFENRVLPLLSDFSAISVREESSAEYLRSLGLKNIACVCDPTILHCGNFYEKEFSLSHSDKAVPFIYRIRVNIPEQVKSIIYQDYKMVDLEVDSTICSVTEWLSNIYNAMFIITDSFHCAVFCILFHKPFVILANYGSGKGMNERFQTLLGKTGLLYRVLPPEPTKKDVEERLNRPIDWGKIDSIMEDWRAYSIGWLHNALN